MKLVRMTPGHGDVLLAEGDPEVAEDEERLVEEFRRQLDLGMWAAVPDGPARPPGGGDGPRLRGGPARRGAGRLLSPGRGRAERAPASSGGRESCCEPRSPSEEFAAYERLGFFSVPGRGDPASGYAYLVYPHRPLVAYETLTGRLLSEYCVRFRDDGVRLPDADDVLAKWLALHGRERELIATANVNPPGHQVDPDHVRRDLALLRGGARARRRLSRSMSAEPPRESMLLARRDPRAMSDNGDKAKTLPRPRSAAVFDGPDRAAARAYMKGVGFDDDALSRPTIGIANTWTEAMPCNFHLRRLAEHIKDGVRAAGGTPMEFNTVAVSDGITMGTKGMKTSLVSREVIADSIELMARGYQFDALVALSACDKTIPGAVMALVRLDIPGVMLYGGSIAPGRWRDHDVTILDVFEAIGAHAAGEMSDQDLHDLEEVASPGAGACGGQFTANTMACAFEALGISPGGSSMVPAEDDEKDTVAEKIGELVIRVLAEDLRPSRVVTRESLENAIACVCASGGSTNGVLHLLAVAHEAGVGLTIDDFERISRRTPLLADLKPGGRFVATDLYRAGGVPLILNRLAEAGILHADELTVSGRTIGEEAASAVEEPGQEVVRPLADPLKSEGGLAILRGNLAPQGAVVKLAGTERTGQTGPARVFESEEDCFAAVKAQAIEPGDIVVIRNEGPPGGPGCGRCCR